MKLWTQDEIKAFRQTHDLYQQDLAAMLRVTKEYICNLEGGVRSPSNTMRALLDCLEKQVSKENVKVKGGRRMSIREKIYQTFQVRTGQEFSRQEIIQRVARQFPETNEVSVLPSDYCYNLYNKGIPFSHHFFEYLDRNRYKVLGVDYPYTGQILWKGKTIGEWRNGNKIFFERR